MLKLLSLSVLLSLLAVSCAPGAFGPGSRANPIRNSIGDITEIRQNSEVFLLVDGPMRLITRKQADQALDALTPNTKPQTGQKFKADVVWFRVKNVLAPKGTDVTLVRQTAIREVGEVGTSSFSIFDSVELVFSVKASSNVLVGPYPISVELTNVDNAQNTGAVTMFVSVKPANTQP